MFQLSEQYIGENVCTAVSDVQSDLELPLGVPEEKAIMKADIWRHEGNKVEVVQSY